MLVLLRGNYEPFQRGRQGGGGQAGHELVSEGSAPWGTGGQCKGQLRVDTMKVEMHGAGCPADLSGSQGCAGTAPTAQADLDLRKNGASIGIRPMNESMAEHAEILEAFGDRDPDGAEAAMRRHLSRTVELLYHEADLIERNGGV